MRNKQHHIDIDIRRKHARVAHASTNCYIQFCTHFCLFLSEMASHSGTFARAWGTKGPKSPWIRCRGPCLNFGTISMSSSSAMNSNSAAVNFPKPPASEAGIVTSACSKRAAQQQQAAQPRDLMSNLHFLRGHTFFDFQNVPKCPRPPEMRCSM